MTEKASMLPLLVLFAVFGAFIGSMAISVAEIERSIGASHLVFGALLASALLVGGLTSALISVRAERHGTARTMRESLVVWSALALVAAAVSPKWLIAVCFVLAFGGAGSVDVVMNTIATKRVDARPDGLLRIHALFSLGAACGAATAGVVIAQGWNWRYTWAAIALISFALAFCRWDASDTAASAESKTENHIPLHAAFSSVIRNGLAVLALAFLFSAVIEGGMDAWGPLFLRQTLDSGVAQGATATAVGYFVGFCSRLAFSVLSARFGARRCALLGSTLATAGLCVMASAHSSSSAAVGLVLAIGGITANWPLLISFATENRRDAGLITGGLSSAGYAGLVISPAILGVVADVASLRAVIVTLACVGVLVVVCIAAMRSRAATEVTVTR